MLGRSPRFSHVLATAACYGNELGLARARYNQRVVALNFAVSDTTAALTFYRTQFDQCSSLLKAMADALSGDSAKWGQC